MHSNLRVTHGAFSLSPSQPEIQVIPVLAATMLDLCLPVAPLSIYSIAIKLVGLETVGLDIGSLLLLLLCPEISTISSTLATALLDLRLPVNGEHFQYHNCTAGPQNRRAASVIFVFNGIEPNIVWG
jgi:hypothetical protein